MPEEFINLDDRNEEIVTKIDMTKKSWLYVMAYIFSWIFLPIFLITSKLLNRKIDFYIKTNKGIRWFRLKK